MQIKNHVFLITGGASGLGAATATTLAAEGGKVVLVDLNEEAGQKKADEIGENAIFVKADITSEEQGLAAIKAGVDKFGHLHGVVNCAGIAPGERILSKNGIHRLDTFKRAVEINLVGSFNMLRLGAEEMAKNEPETDGERGIVINTASVAAFEGQIGQIAYSASKGGVAGMTIPAARDLSSLGIRVTCIAPGIFETPMMAGMPQHVQDSLAANTPFPKRLGRADEYAALVKYMVENVMINGETVRLDGAVRLAPR